MLVEYCKKRNYWSCPACEIASINTHNTQMKDFQLIDSEFNRYFLRVAVLFTYGNNDSLLLYLDIIMSKSIYM